MEDEYNSITRQSRVGHYLQTLHLNKIAEKESCDVYEALEKLRDIITKFTIKDLNLIELQKLASNTSMKLWYA